MSIIGSSHETGYMSKQLISYIGNKRKLVDFITAPLDDIKKKLGKQRLNMLDGFAGSGVVSRAFKHHASMLHSNDLETYAAAVGRCYLTDVDSGVQNRVVDALKWMNASKLSDRYEPGIIERLYAPEHTDDIQDGERVFYTNENARIIDNVRRMIDEVDEDLRDFCTGPLLYRASVHTNTSGVFKGFYKNSETKRGQFGGNAQTALSRIMAEIEIPVPFFDDAPRCDVVVHQTNTNDLVKNVGELDVAYFDPPYNQHPYGSNYFMLNIICDYEEPSEISDVSGIPSGWNKSDYNRKASATAAFDDLFGSTDAKFILTSYSDGGILTLDEIVAIAGKYGAVQVSTVDYPIFRARRPSDSASSAFVSEMLIMLRK